MRRRGVGLFFICSAIVPLAIVSAAWACGVLATLSANPSSAAPGAQVQVTGANYGSTAGATSTCGGAPCSAVTLRWNSRTGPKIGEDATVDGTGRIDTTATIPAGAKSGDNLILALQNTSTGATKSGTPGRTTINVVGGSRSVPGGAWGPSKPEGPAGTAGVVRLDGAESAAPALLPTLLGGLLSVGLLGIGLTLVRRSRTAKPALGI